MCSTLEQRALAGDVIWEQAQPIVQALIEGSTVSGATVVTPPGTAKRDDAEQRRVWCESFYRTLGFNVTVPKPRFSNRVWTRETDMGRVVVPHAPASLIPYKGFKCAVGEGNHWTVTDEAKRQTIVWEPTDEWYWFWADAQDTCPRLETSWNDLTAKHRLLSLEEYTLLWHMVKAERRRLLDVRTWTWLRTRFALGALYADGYEGQVVVGRYSAGGLSVADGIGGGRAADVVK